MSNATTEHATTGSSAELWDVRLATGETKMTVDQIDAGFQQGWIDASTPVRAPGAFEWTTLGAAAGLDDGTETLVRDQPGAADAEHVAARDHVESLSEEDIETVLREDGDRITWSPRKSRRRRGIALVALFGVLLGAGIFATVHWAGAFKQSAPTAAVVTTASPATSPEAAGTAQPAKQSSTPAVAPRTAAAKTAPARSPRHQPAKAKATKDKDKAKAKAAKQKQPDSKKAKPAAAKPAPRPAPHAASTPSYGRLPGT
jgi:pyruvate/2-oxoglutarate dehydrogenase complex dihydrolipoamide acyltransferase (E2) component